MQKKHMEELRNREWREMMVVCTFSVGVLVYACVALIMRE
jgi:hypothetical protein